MRTKLISLVVLLAAAQVFYQTVPCSSASIAGSEDHNAPQTTTLHPLIEYTTSYGIEGSDNPSAFARNTLFLNGIHITAYVDGSRRIEVIDLVILHLDPNRVITEIASSIASDDQYLGQTLAEYYPSLDRFLETWIQTWNRTKESQHVVDLVDELSSLDTTEAIDKDYTLAELEAAVEDNDESDNLCPICRAPISGDDFLVLDCEHEFHIRCIWEWRRLAENPSCPMCRRHFHI